MDIDRWLRNLCPEKHEAEFRENKVDAAVLPKLTAEAQGFKGCGGRGSPQVALRNRSSA
jgi:hypothetical protein